MREKLYAIIAPNNKESRLSTIYDFIMMAVIIISIVPLAFKNSNIVFQYIDYVTVAIFILDYLFRLITADYELTVKLLFCLVPVYSNGDHRHAFNIAVVIACE